MAEIPYPFKMELVRKIAWEGGVLEYIESQGLNITNFGSDAELLRLMEDLETAWLNVKEYLEWDELMEHNLDL